jgi:hypothetical protein
MTARDRFVEAKRLDLEGLELARRRGARTGEANCLMHLLADHFLLGEWDDVLVVAAELEEIGTGRWHTKLMGMPPLLIARGEVENARHEVELDETDRSDEVQSRVMHALAEATVLRAEGRPGEALSLAEEARAELRKLQARHPFFKHLLVEAVEAAFDLDDLDRVTELLAEWERMRPVDRTPFLEAHRERFVARLSALRGENDRAGEGFGRAAAIFGELQMPFYRAVALLELAELTGDGASLAEAREIFERLGAKPWLERAAGVGVEVSA